MVHAYLNAYLSAQAECKYYSGVNFNSTASSTQFDLRTWMAM